MPSHITVDPRFGPRMRQLRQQRGISFRALANRVLSCKTSLQEFEVGKSMPSVDTARRIDEALDAGGELVALLSAAECPAGLGEQENAMKRRDVLQSLTALATGAAGVPLVSLEAIRHGVGVAFGGVPQVDEWESIVTGYARDFYTIPPAELLADLSADLVVLQHLVSASGEVHARDLSRAGGQLSVIMAMTLASLGQARAARRWWTTARQAADRSTDAVTRVWVRDWEAVNGLYERRPIPELLDLADEATAIDPTLASAGMAGALSGKAQALSILGRAEEAQAALRNLEAVCERLPSSVVNDGTSMFGWPEYRLRHTESYVHTYLGNTGAAYAAQDRAFAIYPPELAREQTQMQMHRARCMVIEGHIGDGLEYAMDALEELPQPMHNALLYQVGRTVTAAVPEGERGRPALNDLHGMLTLPAAS